MKHALFDLNRLLFLSMATANEALPEEPTDAGE